MTAKIVFKRAYLILISIIGQILFVNKISRIFRGGKGSWRILRYHSVSDERKHETNVTSGSFKRQIEFLKDNCHIISLREGALRIVNGAGFDKDYISVTFDDGYMDNYVNAYPVLKLHGIQTVIMLITGFIGTKNILHHDRFDDPKYNYLLTWDQIENMDKSLIEYGSHTDSHFRMSECGDEIYEKEILTSIESMETNAGIKVQFISYPFGTQTDFSDNWIKYLQKAGFLCGCLASYGINTSISDLYKLKRIGIEASDTLFTFKAKINGSADLFLLLGESDLFRYFKRLINRCFGAVDYK